MTTHESESQKSQPVEIEGSNGIKLKQLFIEDAQRYFDLLEHNREYFRQQHDGGTDNTAEKYPDVASLIHSITHPDNPERQRFGIWDGDTMVGSINLTPEEGHTAEIGYWVGEQYAGQGYGTEAVKLFISCALSQPSIEKLFADVYVGNDASKKVLLKSGFQYEKLYKREKDDGEIEWLWRFKTESPAPAEINT